MQVNTAFSHPQTDPKSPPLFSQRCQPHHRLHPHPAPYHFANTGIQSPGEWTPERETETADGASITRLTPAPIPSQMQCGYAAVVGEGGRLRRWGICARGAVIGLMLGAANWLDEARVRVGGGLRWDGVMSNWGILMLCSLHFIRVRVLPACTT